MTSIERCNELIKPEKANWIGISNQVAIKEVLEKLEKKDEVVNLQDRIIKLMIKDFQLEGFFKDMKYEEVVEYYKRRKDL